MQFICGKTKFFVLKRWKQDWQVGLLFTPERCNYFLIKKKCYCQQWEHSSKLQERWNQGTFVMLKSLTERKVHAFSPPPAWNIRNRACRRTSCLQMSWCPNMVPLLTASLICKKYWRHTLIPSIWSLVIGAASPSQQPLGEPDWSPVHHETYTIHSHTGMESRTFKR